MNFVAGVLAGSGTLHAADACRRVLRGLDHLGGGLPNVEGEASFALGSRPEPNANIAAAAYGPALSPTGRFLLIADVRIANCEELISNLGVSQPACGPLVDGEILAHAWERWGPEACEHVIGDFAAAVWNKARRELTLVRSPGAYRTIFYVQAPGLFAFSSTPEGLQALPGVGKSLDLQGAAHMLAGNAYPGGRSIFTDVRLLRHGTALTTDGERCSLRDTCRMQAVAQHRGSKRDIAKELRERLEFAVRAQLRRPGRGVAAQLSAGRDSSSVTATAARVLAGLGERLTAVTGAPAIGFSGPAFGDRLTDESALAAETARMFVNIDHRICRTQPLNIADELDMLHRLHFGPVLTPSNLGWWRESMAQAAAAGASVLLVGDAGNLTISAGGPLHLHDLLARRGPLAALRAAGAIGGRSGAQWRSVAKLMSAPYLPHGLYRAALQWSGRLSPDEFRFQFLRNPLRTLAEQVSYDVFRDWRPLRSGYEYRFNVLRAREPGERVVRARWGLDLRDPTADRRLIDFTFSIPPEFLVSRSDERPLWEEAFAGMLPSAVLHNRKRGYQGADWYETFNQAQCHAAWERYRGNAAVSELINGAAVEEALDRWPTSGWDRGEQVDTYRYQLISTLALASFLHVQFT